MKRGIILWTSIALIPALAIVGWAIFQLNGQIDNYIEMNTRFQAIEIAGIFNVLQSSPDETVHEHIPPYCAEIEDHNIKIKDTTSDIEIITTSVEIESGTIGCNGGDSFVREDKVRIRSSG